MTERKMTLSVTALVKKKTKKTKGGKTPKLSHNNHEPRPKTTSPRKTSSGAGGRRPPEGSRALPCPALPSAAAGC